MNDVLNGPILDSLEQFIGRETADSMTRMFLSQGPAMIDRIRAALNPVDEQQIRYLCHELTGSASTLGAALVTEVAHQIRARTIAGAPQDELIALLEGLERAYGTTEAALTARYSR